jgi:hypothetical protein
LTRAQRPSSKRHIDSSLSDFVKNREPSVNKLNTSSKITTVSSKNQQFAKPADAALTRLSKISEESFLSNLGHFSQNEQVYKKRQEEIVKRI